MRKYRLFGAIAVAIFQSVSGAGFSAVAIAGDVSEGPSQDNAYDANYVGAQPQGDFSRNIYIRSDVGLGNTATGGFSQSDLSNNGGSFLTQSVGNTFYIDAGIGLQLSSHLRFDVTGEYRAGTSFTGRDNITAELLGPAGSLQANTDYSGKIRSFAGMLNGYWDLFNYAGFTPYVGGGLGFASITASGVNTSTSATFVDAATGVRTVQATHATSQSHSQTNFAWALMAGTSIDLSPNAKLDIGYRYIDLGSGISASTDLLECSCGTIGQPLKLSDLDAHEFRIGVRWALGADPTRSDATPRK